MTGQDKELLAAVGKILGNEDYALLLKSVGFEGYNLVDRVGLDNIDRNKLILVFSKIPEKIVNKLASSDYKDHPKIKFLKVIKRFQNHVEDENLFHKILEHPELITEEDYSLLESRISFTFARELINDFRIKNSVIVKISRPYAFIMK